MCAVVAACAACWHLYQAGQREIADANAVVEANIKVYLPDAFAPLSETVSRYQPLTPATVYSGKNSRIVAFNVRTEENWVGPNKASWDILAQSKSGTYFDVTYDLCANRDADKRGANRISRSHWPLRALTVDQAKDWLYRTGLRQEFKTEFGTDAPPVSVQG